MASQQSSDSSMAFLVERYLPAAAADSLPAAVSRVAQLCASRPGTGVRYLHSVYLPSEETCFCLFRGPSAEAVRDVNREAGFALDRITDAVLLLPGGDNDDRPTEQRLRGAR